MFLINCEIKLILTWSDISLLSNDTKATSFAITDTKLYVPVVTLSTQDNTKQQLKEQLIGTNMNQKYQQKQQTHI